MFTRFDNCRKQKTRDVALREAVVEFCDISCWQNPTAVTLTMKKGLERNGVFIPATPERCQQNLRHALNKINHRIYGNRSRKVRMECVPVLEQDASGRFHYHLALNRPQEVSEDFFPLMMASVWMSTHWGYKQADFQSNADAGWIEYITKLRSKAEFDESIDWGNFRLVR